MRCGSKILLLLWCCYYVYAPASAADCKLNSANINNQKDLYLTQKRGNWQLLRHDEFSPGETIYLCCGTSSRYTYKVATCQQNGTFDTTLPVDTCDTPLRATLEPASDPSCNALNGTFYKVGFKINNNFLTLFESCFDGTLVKTHYVKHKIYHHTVAAGNIRSSNFVTDRLITGRAKESFKASNVSDTFTALLGAQPAFISSSNKNVIIIERGHLAPAGDFMSFDQIRETNRHINLFPQFREINRSNWKRIEDWVRKLLRSKNDVVTVVTGVSGVLELPHLVTNQPVQMFLFEGNKNPIPSWVYKVVHSGSRCYAFVTFNNEFATSRPPAPYFCTVQNCPAGLNFNENLNAGASYCCDATRFNVGRQARICDTLRPQVKRQRGQ